MGLAPALLLLPLAAFVAVDSSVSTGLACAGQARVTTTEGWKCNRDGSVYCSSVVEDCAKDKGVGGSATFLPDGSSTAVGGGGWDCRHKCRGNHGQSGSQSKTSYVPAGGGSVGGGSSSGGSFVGGSSSGGSGGDGCSYTCLESGGCKSSYGGAFGSCFSKRFGGSCSGIPAQCRDCNTQITCCNTQQTIC